MQTGIMRFAVAGACIALCSCSTLNLDAANKLVTSGRATSSSGQAFILLPKTQNTRWVESVTFAAVYPQPSPGDNSCPGVVVTPLTPAQKASIQGIYAQLSKTAEFFDRLDAAYAALGDLAAYDDQAAFETSIGGLASALNTYAGANIAPNVSAPFAKVAGFYVQDRRKRRIAEGSAAIQAVLKTFVGHLETHSSAFVTLPQTQIGDSYMAAKVLWCRGLLDARPMLRDVGSGFGLDPLGPDPILSTNDPQLRDAVIGLLDQRGERAKSAVDGGFKRLVGSLHDLIDLHQKLQEGDPVDATFLAAKLSELRGIVQLYAPEKAL